MDGTIRSEHIENRERSQSERKQFLKLFAVCMLFGIFAYLVLIANELTNTYDGMWKGSFYSGYEYNWVISIGRWFWPFVGKLRSDFSPEPFTSLASLALIALGSCMAVRLIGDSQKHALPLYLAALCITVSTAVCVRLSYRYMSPTFGASFMLSICAVSVTQRSLKLKWLISMVMIVLSLALYQADIGCTCFLFLVVLIRQLVSGEDWKTVGLFILKAILSIICACIVYRLIWKLYLTAYYVIESDYNGANSLSVLRMVTMLPGRAAYAYQEFMRFFFGSGILHNTFQSSVLFRFVHIGVGLTCILLCGKAYTVGEKTKVFRVAAVAACCLLIPLAAHFSFLLAPDAGGLIIQMTMPCALVVPVLTCLGAETAENTIQGKTGKLYWRYCLCALVFVLYGNFLQVSLDQHVMLQSKNTTLSLMDRIVADLEANGFAEAENTFIFIGRPAENQNYRKDETWNNANPYARYGEFWTGGDCDTQSYYGLMRDGGYNLNINWNHEYWHELEKNQMVIEMPAYPQKGYAEYDGNHNVIVKIS